MTEFETKTIALLGSIDASMKRLVGIVTAKQVAAKGPDIAPDRELDGKHGDEKIKFDPRDWTGPSQKGNTMSQCPPEYLDEVARAFEYFADKNDRAGINDAEGRPKSMYDRRSAGRARGWAKRLRAGWKPPPPPPPMTDAAGAEAFGSGGFPAAADVGMALEDDPFADEPKF
jgi:hypothetical protein